MARGLSAYLANKLLDHAFRNVTYTPPTTIYAKMHIGDSGGAGTANASAQTTRVAVAWNAAASGSVTLTGTPEFTLNAGETITDCSFWDNPTTGNFLFSAQASVSKAGVSGDIIRISTNTLSLTPLAA
jgi:hypothetical protein